VEQFDENEFPNICFYWKKAKNCNLIIRYIGKKNF
jgi:hypothetical protein